MIVTMKTILILTVGGSHEPILRAIADVQPDHICFVCSDDDPASGQKGSYIQISGKGNVIKARFSDTKPTLPNIPTQVGLEEPRFEIIKVSPDDFDDVYHKVLDWLCRQDRDENRVLADYTGGTKTMSAALAVAALDSDGVELQLVSGSRSNLVKVESGSEQVIGASVESSRFHRKLHQAVETWHRYAYDETVALLEKMRPPHDRKLLGDYQCARDLSQALAAWDRFDHAEAEVILSRYKSRIGKVMGLHLTALKILNEKESKRRDPLQLYDLWLNAQRRAIQGRYDDAVARVYRLLEWTAQWQLRIHAGIDTSNIPAEKIPDKVNLSQNREGKYQAGLYQAWQLLQVIFPDNPAARFFKENDEKMLDHLLIRNQSILAHGYAPVTSTQWKQMQGWMEAEFLPMLKVLAKQDADIRFDIASLQLPEDFLKVSGSKGYA